MMDWFWDAAGRQLRNPQGFAGWLVGHLMCLINSSPNTLAIAALSVGSSHHVLEVGFGPGCALNRLARLAKHGRVRGIDSSPTMLTQARARNHQAILAGTMELDLGRHDSLPLKDGSIDRILAVNVAYFFDKKDAAFAEMCRVLKPGGRMVIYVTAESSMRNWKFASTKSHHLFTSENFSELLPAECHHKCTMTIQSVRIPLGIRGLLAVICKGDAQNRIPPSDTIDQIES